MFSILAYGGSPAGNGVNVDIPAITDPSFSTRNGHFIFTEEYKLLAIGAFGAHLTNVQMFDATWNAINIPNVYPVNLAIVPPSNPMVRDLRDWPIGIPQNEEIAFQTSNNNGTVADPEYALIYISTPNDSRALPQAMSGIGNKGRVLANVSFTTALNAGQWTADVPIVFNNLIRGGTYCIAGAWIVVPFALAYRINFVKSPFYKTRKLYPGGLVENAYGNVPQKEGGSWLGPMGYFDTFEFPLISILGTTNTGSATYTGYLDLIYTSADQLQNQPLQGN